MNDAGLLPSDRERRLDVVTLGEAMALLVAATGVRLEHAIDFRRTFAGAEMNAAIALTRLGHRVSWVGRVGDDEFGRGIVRTLRGEGVNTAGVIVDSGAPTGLMVRDHGPATPIRVRYYRAGSAGSRLCPSDLDVTAVQSARVLHVTGVTGMISDSAQQTLMSALEHAADAGTAVSFDPNLRLSLGPLEAWYALADAIASRAAIVQVGLGEGSQLTGADTPEGIAAWFFQRGARLVAVKDGSRSAWVSDGDSVWVAEPPRAASIDPVGAGDGFDAGFLSGLLAALPPSLALDRAMIVGRCVVEAVGDIEGLPYLSDLRRPSPHEPSTDDVTR